FDCDWSSDVCSSDLFAGGPIPDAPQPTEEGAPGEVQWLETFTPGPPAAQRYLADLEVNGGNSGGPVYLVETAAVIGVCVATQSEIGRASCRERGEAG